MTRFLDSLASTLAGMLIATLILAISAPQAFVWSAAPRPALPAESPRPAARTEAPRPQLRVAVAAPPSPSAVLVAAPEPPADAKATQRRDQPVTAITGVASFVAPGYGAGYLALPDGPGHRVTICGRGGCVTRTSNDAGPDRAMQRAGRVADLSFADFARVCGCDPWIVGLVRVEVTR